MNVNEVLANRANEHPRIGARQLHADPSERSRQHGAVDQRRDPDGDPPRRRWRSPAISGPPSAACATRCSPRAREFDDVLKSGRTHLQDAMPIRLGQEFRAYGVTIERNLQRQLKMAATSCAISGIGGSAVGTGVNVEPAVSGAHGRALARRSTGSSCAKATDRIQLMQSMGDVAGFSGALRTLAVDLEQDRERPAAAGVRAAHRTRRDRAAGGAAGLVDHAGQGESVDPRDGEPGLLPGDRQRHLRAPSRPSTVSSSST